MGPQHSGGKQQHSPQREEGVQQPQGSPHPTHGPASSCRDWEFHRNSMQGGETEARQHPGTGRGDVLQGQVPKTKKEEKKGQKKKKKKHQRKHSAEAPQPHSPRCGFEVEKGKTKKNHDDKCFFRCFSHPVICRHHAAIPAAVWQSNPAFLVGLGKCAQMLEKR